MKYLRKFKGGRWIAEISIFKINEKKKKKKLQDSNIKKDSLRRKSHSEAITYASQTWLSISLPLFSAFTGENGHTKEKEEKNYREQLGTKFLTNTWGAQKEQSTFSSDWILTGI